MKDMPEVHDELSLEAWLQGQPRDVAIAIVTRAVLRVLPVYWSWFLSAGAQKTGLGVLPLLRASLTSAVATNRQTQELRSVAEAIRDRATRSAHAVAAPVLVASSQDFAKEAAGTVADIFPLYNEEEAEALGVLEKDIPSSIWRAIQNDCVAVSQDRLESAARLFETSLWPDVNPFAQVWSDLKPRILSPDDRQSGDWSFWIDWYDQMLDPQGKAPKWDFWEQVALLPGEAWSGGQEGIAREVARLELEADPVDVDDADMKVQSIAEQISKLRVEVSGLATNSERVSQVYQKLVLNLEGLSKQIEFVYQKNEQNAHKIDDLHNRLTAEYAQKFEDHIATYSQARAIREPVQLWQDKQKEHQDRMKAAFRWFVGCLVLLGLVLAGFVGLMAVNEELLASLFAPFGCDPITKPELCNGFSFKGMAATGAVLSFLSLALWFIRLQMKEYLSERHLVLDARERRAFAQTYIGLLAEGEQVTEEAKEQRALVYAALFRPSADGIIKDDAGIDPSIAAALSKMLSK